MANQINVPDIGDFKDVEVIDVLVKPGDKIDVDTPLLTIETEKATMDVPSPSAGVVKSVALKKGDRVSKGTLIVEVEGDAAKAETPKSEVSKAEAPKAQAPAPVAADASKPAESPKTASAPSAKPATQQSQIAVPDIGTVDGSTHLASELGLDSAQVMDMIMEIEDRLDISIPVAMIAEARTLDQLCESVRRVVGNT